MHQAEFLNISVLRRESVFRALAGWLGMALEICPTGILASDCKDDPHYGHLRCQKFQLPKTALAIKPLRNVLVDAAPAMVQNSMLVLPCSGRTYCSDPENWDKQGQVTELKSHAGKQQTSGPGHLQERL